MIRHFNGKNTEQIAMQSKRGAIWVVEWSFTKHRIVLTAQEGEKVRSVWKRWKKRQGKNVVGHRVVENGRRAEGCFVVKYDPHTRKVLDVR